VCVWGVQLLVWNAAASTAPVLRYADHNAAVKAIAWSPHQHGLLVSGGGTADRCMRFWNTVSGAPLQCIDTGSQVCNIMWSKSVNEIVSTHGYSLNQIIVWKYPSMSKVATLTGHTYRWRRVVGIVFAVSTLSHPWCLLPRRVLYLAMSPDGQTIVTGAGDETLRFWNVFPGPKSQDTGPGASVLFPGTSDIR
jgi:cell division cycle 20-like protein 1, cofactor of APC complex